MATKTVSFRLPTELVELIEADALTTGRSKTQVVIAALAKFYDYPYALPESITLEQLQEQLNELRRQLSNLSAHIPLEFSPTNSKQDFVTRHLNHSPQLEGPQEKLFVG